MSNAKFLDLLSANKTLLADGAMGTMLHGRGIGFDQCFDELNLTNPAAVAEERRAYIEAGAQSILTNTFGANRYKLARHGLEDKVAEINQAGEAVRAACEVGMGLAPLPGRPQGSSLPIVASVTFTRSASAMCSW